MEEHIKIWMNSLNEGIWLVVVARWFFFFFQGSHVSKDLHWHAGLNLWVSLDGHRSQARWRRNLKPGETSQELWVQRNLKALLGTSHVPPILSVRIQCCPCMCSPSFVGAQTDSGFGCEVSLLDLDDDCVLRPVVPDISIHTSHPSPSAARQLLAFK